MLGLESRDGYHKTLADVGPDDFIEPGLAKQDPQDVEAVDPNVVARSS